MKRVIFAGAVFDLLLVGISTILNVNTILNPDASHNAWGNPLGQTGFVLQSVFGIAGLVLSLLMVILVLIAAGRGREWGWFIALPLLLVLALIAPFATGFLGMTSESPWYIFGLAVLSTCLPLLVPLAALMYSRRADAGALRRNLPPSAMPTPA